MTISKFEIRVSSFREGVCTRICHAYEVPAMPCSGGDLNIEYQTISADLAV
jgi:hypothetical protein